MSVLLLFAVACAPGDAPGVDVPDAAPSETAPPPSYAGCTVTTRVTGADGALVSTRISHYDAEARLYADSWEIGDSTEESVTTWVDGCPAHQEVTWMDPTLTRVRTAESTCDGYGDVVRTDTVDVETYNEITERFTGGYTYLNDHDADGRLVHVRIDEHDDGIRQQDRTYAWGACDEPVFFSFHNDAGDSGHTTRECREDGQTVATDTRWYDADGAPSMVRRGTYTYDARGHWLTRVTDAGEGTDVVVHYTATWNPGDDPGPAEVVFRRGADLAIEVTSTYTYDCPA